jgi:uncharacterized protein YyaL (SSP411 family)
MFSLSFISRAGISFFGCGLLGLLGSCSKERPRELPKEERAIVRDLPPNALGRDGSTFLADQTSAPILWQPWARGSFELARDSNRLVLALIALPQHADTEKTLRALYADSGAVKDLNERFVPVLVDGDIHREVALTGAVLCMDSKIQFALPQLVWLTGDGNPVASIPVQGSEENIRSIVQQSNGVVIQMLEDSPDYVQQNSERDNALRRSRMAKEAAAPESSQQPMLDTQRAIRQLASFYDESAGLFDSAGGLVPSGSIELLAGAVTLPGLSAADVREVRNAAVGVARLISRSPLVDPLDGGVFSGRRGQTWSLPMAVRDCQTNAKVILALCSAQSLAQDELLDAQITAAVAFVEKNYATPGGLFALGRQATGKGSDWLWSLDELKGLLSAEELEVWTALSHLTSVGNVGMETDPARSLFGKNTLRINGTPESAAAGLGISADEARGRFESGRAKLLAAREARGVRPEPDSKPHAASTFRMISAYAAASNLTGDASLRQKAIETLGKAKAAFSKGADLYFFEEQQDESSSGRAFLYGLAIQAALDVYDITLDPSARDWALDLSVTASERFMKGDTFREATDEQSLIPLPVTDRTMVYDDSSVGLFAAAEARFAKLLISVPPVYGTAVTGLPKKVLEVPFAHTDILYASLVRSFSPVVILAADVPEELKNAALALPIRLVTRRMAGPAEEVLPGKAIVQFPGQEPVTVGTPSEMKAAVILAGGQGR